MNAVGTNTAHEHQRDRDDRAGDLLHRASRVASIGGSPSSMCRSTFSTTTIASSTTMPMASTRPKSDSVLSENPRPSITANVPTSETGTATSGMIDARHVCRKTHDHDHDQQDRLEQRVRPLH